MKFKGFGRVALKATGLAAVASALVMLMLATVQFIGQREANATQAFNRQTGLPCAQCHTNPAGGGALTAKGRQFKANGYSFQKKK